MACYQAKVFEKLSLAVLLAGGVSLSTFGGQTIYFLVGLVPWFTNPPVRESYVLPLSEQKDIDYARYLISAGLSLRFSGTNVIVLANCVAGGDGINRNYLDPKFPSWSWHVSQFLEFGFATADNLDGSPSYTEYMYSNAPPGGQFEIGYWRYTVVQELGPAPLMLSITPQGENLEFYWSAPGTNYVYTLEGSESLRGTDWFALAGDSWPLMTNRWTLPRTNAPARFYRVRGQSPALSQSTRSGGASRIPSANSS